MVASCVPGPLVTQCGTLMFAHFSRLQWPGCQCLQWGKDVSRALASSPLFLLNELLQPAGLGCES